jgi:hypothetical protein
MTGTFVSIGDAVDPAARSRDQLAEKASAIRVISEACQSPALSWPASTFHVSPFA